MKIIEGNLIDIDNREFYPCAISISDGKIVAIERNSNSYDQYISPGLIDAHVHVESSMLMPTEFSQLVIPNGTVGVVADPHEIANVLGIEGVELMIDNGEKAPLKFFWGIPSCVPATSFDKPGHILSVEDTEKLASTGRFTMLSEVMNVSGVIHNDPDIIEKIEIAKKYHLKIDGHAPELKGDSLSSYIVHGIETDHESSTIEEAEEKISKGMHVIIREGSAAKNYEALKSLIATSTDYVMFCTDDSHADDLLNKGHINKIVKKALSDGFGIFDVLQIACINPVRFYHLDIGTLHIGDPADFIILNDIDSLDIDSTFIQGEEVYSKGMNKDCKIVDVPLLNVFHHDKISEIDICTNVCGDIPCIQIIPDSILTDRKTLHIENSIKYFQSDITLDVLKIVYLNRYFNSKPQVGFISGIGLKRGAFASSISHDSHNIIAVGCTDADLVRSINELIEEKGGLVVNNGDQLYTLPLPIGGIISNKSGWEVADQYMKLNEVLAEMGTDLKSPFMTLSFMALIVIPSLKIGEEGIFDFDKFDFVK
ncbi:adenine deaminase [Odoribacter sp. AF15-53]|uniref:adenine deaminase n=1 Tax=Odoribacter sp. AF15-53 TaxID=2292236 RepID=UPI000E52908C|nr:adenine deaminase [Odoribacter sp. AF15-53]RHR79690.1 adenine deaminase [Odoribacter sp. AF15-53]